MRTRPRHYDACVSRWRRERDSNPRTFRSTVFKTAALNHSAIPPRGNLAQTEFACQDDRQRAQACSFLSCATEKLGGSVANSTTAPCGMVRLGNTCPCGKPQSMGI